VSTFSSLEVMGPAKLELESCVQTISNTVLRLGRADVNL
jgi:hypothetical protein